MCIALWVQFFLFAMWFKPSLARCVSVLLPVVVLAGCSAPPAPASFGSSWKKVNAFTVGVERIPFYQPHVYGVRALDGTLQGTLHRWAAESGSTLDYRASADFSLPREAGRVRSESLAQALEALNRIYAPYGIALSQAGVGNVIVVQDLSAEGVHSPAQGAMPQDSSGDLSFPAPAVSRRSGVDAVPSAAPALVPTPVSPTQP